MSTSSVAAARFPAFSRAASESRLVSDNSFILLSFHCSIIKMRKTGLLFHKSSVFSLF
jgi:hypothetical protein